MQDHVETRSCKFVGERCTDTCAGTGDECPWRGVILAAACRPVVVSLNISTPYVKSDEKEGSDSYL